jgi:hypothetical protein
MRGMKLPRFSLRTLFVLIALFACMLSWRQSTLDWIKQRNQYLGAAFGHFKDEFESDGYVSQGVLGVKWDHERAGLPWSLWVWGGTVRVKKSTIIHVSPITVDSTTDRMKQLFPEAEIVFGQN